MAQAKKPSFSVQSVAWHTRSVQDTLKLLQTDPQGVSSIEAAARLQQYGRNEVKRTKHFEGLKILLRQFADLLIILLVVSTGIAWWLGDTRVASVLAVIIIINILIGFFQEYRADRLMRSLQNLLRPEAKVVRGGELIALDATELVPGDIVQVEAGDSVPADIRLITAMELMTNDYALTGESSPSSTVTTPLSANLPVADRSNMIYMGTTVATGSGRGVVVATGMRTELGTIAKLSQESKPDSSPLQLEIRHLAKRITQGTVILMTVLVGVSLGAKFGWADSFVFAIGIAAAMIPQGLPAEVNVALSQAASKLARSRALVKRLTAVETLGATQIICTDKTGTLTKNEMTVTTLMSADGIYRVSGIGFAPQGSITNAKGVRLTTTQLGPLLPLLRCGLLANNATVHEPDSEHLSWYSVGDPTEAALVSLALKAGLSDTRQSVPKLHEYSFDSDRKRMSVVVKSDRKQVLYCKGAPESVLSSCTHILIAGKVTLLTTTSKQQVMDYVDQMSEQAMRNLGLAYREVSAVPEHFKEAEAKMVFLGVASMIDPPREEVAEAMAAAKRAHMLVTIITGDEARTATAIAAQIGFGSSHSPVVITGQQFTRMSDSAVAQAVRTGHAIFARVSPTDKLRIVNILKHSGAILAVTGDGINDAPALRRADIGVAMGRTGSDVAKEAAEIVLLDDSFHTLVEAIGQGRVIFQNIRKTVHACITTNFGELGIVLIGIGLGTLMGFPLAISVPQILAIDLMAELFPLAALGWDPPTSNIMDDKPRKLKNHIMNTRAIFDIVLSGFVMSVLAYINFLVVFGIAGSTVSKTNSLLYAQATTTVYLTIVFCQYVNVLSRRTAPGQSIFSRYLFTNWHLWASFGLSLFGIAVIIYVPSVAVFFGNGAVTVWQWGLAIVVALMYLGLREVAKVRWQLTAS